MTDTTLHDGDMPSTDDDANLQAIRQLTPVVVAEHDKLLHSIEKERYAAEKLLRQVLLTIVPALPALVSRIPSKKTVNHEANTGTVTSFEWCHQKMLYLAGASEPELRWPTDNRGIYGGRGLYVCGGLEPTLRILEYKGECTDHHDEWTADVSTYDLAAVVISFRVSECLENILTAMRGQLNGNKSRVISKSVRAEIILSATATLLGQALTT